MMSKKTRVAAALGLCAAAVVVMMTLALRGGPAPRPAAGAAESGPRVVWPEGRRYTYSVSWRAKTGGEIAPGTDGKNSQVLSMESTIDGEIGLS